MVDTGSIKGVRVIALEDLVADEGYQPREGLSTKHVALLAASEPEEWPPLLVTPCNAGGYYVIDGFHRLEAAKRLGLEELRCVVDRQAGIHEAFAANLKHGLPLTLEERREYACWLHQLDPSLSLRELGRRCGLSHHTVKDALERVEGGQSAHTDRETADAVKRLVRLAHRAAADWQASPLAIFFGSDRQQRAEHVRRQLEGYDAGERPTVAAALVKIGVALIEGARPYSAEGE